MTENQNIPASTNRFRKIVLYGAGIVIGISGLMQFARFVVPEFRLDNPAVKNTIQWDSPETEQLWTQACADCHSNETVYPWYSYIAPIGWMVAHDVHEGRDELNISTDRSVDVDDMVESIYEGEMPMSTYMITHPGARLSSAEQQALIDGLRRTFNQTTIPRNSD